MMFVYVNKFLCDHTFLEHEPEVNTIVLERKLSWSFNIFID